MRLAAELREKWGRLAPRDRRALTLGAVVLVPVLVWTWAIRPYLSALEEARAALETERALLAREEGLLASADLLPAQLERSTLLLAEEARGLIRVENGLQAEAELSDAVQTLAARSRVLIQEIRGLGNDPAETGDIHPIRLALRAESDLEGLAGFLNRVEGGSTRMRVLELSVQPVASSTSRNNRDRNGPDPAQMGALSFSLIVEAYWTATPVGSAAADDIPNTRLTGVPR